MDDEMEFGQVAAAPRAQRLRPDRNPQYAVVPCGDPAPDDLPIFVDLDTLRDMESHALSDPRVELGGVLLGGQYEDERGQPFVVVADALRARHYESTPGSFKFTHDTWAEFTRQRSELPADLQIVGWYHTHPGWGVFLSAQDRFICEHFFRQPADLALVIDPCQGTRGFFQWAGPAPEPPRQTGGFYVFTSRHRALELVCLVTYLENRLMPSQLPRSEGFPFPGIPYPVPLRPQADSRSAWFGAAVLGMLASQFLVLALLAWRTLGPGSAGPVSGAPEAPATRAAAGPEAAGPGSSTPNAAELQLQLLDRVVDQLGTGTPRGLVQMLEQLQAENAGLRADARVYRDLEARVRVENESLARALAAAERTRDELARQVAALQAELRAAELARANQPPAGTAANLLPAAWSANGGGLPEAWLLGAAGLLAAGGLAWAAWAVWKRRRETAVERDSL